MFLVCLALCLLLPLVHAETSKLFQWAFKQSLSTSLPACQEIPLVVKSFNADNSTHGVPPYYMNAFAPGKLPETQLIGTDENNLKWTVNFPVDTQLLLNIVDSNRSSGGVPPALFTVVENPSQASQCGSPTLKDPPQDFIISGNLTKAESCEPWGITIKGGVKPYNITFAALNSPVTTNVTLGAVDDAFTFINRADPNTKLIAAVSDLTGRWATGTVMVDTYGSTDLSCPGLVSTSGIAAVLAKEAAGRAKVAAKQKATLLAGVLTPILVLLVAGGIGGFLWYRKKKRNGEQTGVSAFVGRVKGVQRLNSTDNMAAAAHGGTRDLESAQPMSMGQRSDGTVLSINAYLAGPSTAATTQMSGGGPGSMITSPTYSNMYTGSPTQTMRSDSMSTVSRGPPRSDSMSTTARGHRPGFSSFPARSIRSSTGRGSAKAIEAGYVLEEGDEGGPSSGGALPSSVFHPDSPQALSPDSETGSRPLPTPQRRPGQESVVFQHTDSGMPGVRELPPPYIYGGDDGGEGSVR